MGQNSIKKLSKLKHVSGFSIEQYITDIGMYESAIIELRATELLNDEEPRIEVNSDVKQLQEFLLHRNALMLPCPYCRKEMAFFPLEWSNPIKADKKITVVDYNRKPSNIFDITKPSFTISSQVLVLLSNNDMELVQDSTIKMGLLNDCVIECKEFLLNYASEIRRDYRCSLDASHRIFVNFRLYDPIGADDNADYREAIKNGENEYTHAFEYIKDCLIIQKVGQYPSLADLQMFDVEKYRRVLSKESYRDFTRAIGLNAQGIGAGAFLYLRRILERLIEKCHQNVSNNAGWDEDSYKKLRFDERIKMIEKEGSRIIPEQLRDVKNRIYTILSKGVHESTDEECKELFPYMEYIIESILDEQIRQKEDEDRVKKLKDALNDFSESKDVSKSY